MFEQRQESWYFKVWQWFVDMLDALDEFYMESVYA